MLAKSKRASADAVWHSNRGDDVISLRRAGQEAAWQEGRQPTGVRRTRNSAPRSNVRPTARDGCHEIKFDGYRVQLRVEDGEATLKTRKGLDWTDKFQAIAKEGSALPDVLVDGEIVALDHNGAPDFSTLQAAIADAQDR